MGPALHPHRVGLLATRQGWNFVHRDPFAELWLLWPFWRWEKWRIYTV